MNVPAAFTVVLTGWALASVVGLAVLRDVHGVRTYIPERADRVRHNWRDRSAGEEEAFYANRARMSRAKGRRLSRLRSEYSERSFAHGS
jgi:hypothetical protein